MHPRLTYLAQCYFHQDYDLEAPTPLDVIRKFRDNEQSQVTGALTAETRAVIDRHLQPAARHSPGQEPGRDL